MIYSRIFIETILIFYKICYKCLKKVKHLGVGDEAGVKKVSAMLVHHPQRVGIVSSSRSIPDDVKDVNFIKYWNVLFHRAHCLFVVSSVIYDDHSDKMESQMKNGVHRTTVRSVNLFTFFLPPCDRPEPPSFPSSICRFGQPAQNWANP